MYSCHVGSSPIDLKASFNAAGIDEIVIDGDEVKVTHAGLAGAGVGAMTVVGFLPSSRTWLYVLAATTG